MGAVGYHLVRSPCPCLYFVSRAGGVLRGRGIISDSCQPSALFGIMFLLGVILWLQKSCCLYSEKQRGDWRWVAGFAPTDLKKKKKKFLLHLVETTFAENLRICNNKKGGSKEVHVPIITLVIAWELDTSLLDLWWLVEKTTNFKFRVFSCEKLNFDLEAEPQLTFGRYSVVKKNTLKRSKRLCTPFCLCSC